MKNPFTEKSPLHSVSRTLVAWLGRSTLPLAAVMLLTWTGRAQAPLTNGALHVGEVTAGGENSWSFSAGAGESVVLRVGSTNFTPRIRLFGPGNVLVAEESPNSTLNRDTTLAVQATNAGLHTVLVSAVFPTQSGTYGLHLALAPTAFVISPGDEGGPMENGGLHPGQITLGDLDMWSFTAAAGDSLMLRMGTTNFTPSIRLFGPNGTSVAQAAPNSTLARDTFLTVQAPEAGSYTVVASAVFANQAGSYALHLARAPAAFVVSAGDEGGPLENGGLHPGQIALGDLDLWNFTAAAGDSLFLRMGTTNFTPWLRLYDPNGALVSEANPNSTLNRDTFLTVQATNAGSYTVVASAVFANQAGSYALHLARAPAPFATSAGDEGGPMANGAVNPGALPLGDLDLWSFTAAAGDTLTLRTGSTNFTPWIRLYGPNGALVAEADPNSTLTRDSFLSMQVTNAGLYMAVVSAVFPNQSGSYALHLALAPGSFEVSDGDEGGPLENGALHRGQIALGDLDLWSFTAAAGDNLFLRMGTTNFTPAIRLYGPSGEHVAEAAPNSTLNRDTFITAQATNAGSYTVVAGAAFANQSGSYALHLALAPGPFVVSEGDQGGPLQNGVTYASELSLGDLDTWSFIGTPGDSNVLRVAATSFTPWLRLYGPQGTLVAEAASNSTLNRNAALSYVVTNPGPYTAVLSAAFSGQAGAYTFKQSRVPPDLIMPATEFTDEQTAFNLVLSAQDPDEPLKPLIFTLISGPPGMELSITGSTNATLSWASTETDGPSTNVVVASVTDVVNNQAFTRTNSFVLVVREINTPPQLTVPANQVMDELTPLSISATATDADLPVNPLEFSLSSAPAGMIIDPGTGAISWTPGEAQGPSTNTVVVVVTDTNPPAANAQRLSATNSFTVTVREANLPPQLSVPADQVIDELSPLSVTAAATDPDLPGNLLLFSLVSGPSNMTIDSATGILTWTPDEAQGPSTNMVVVKVQDDGVPSLAATNSFAVVVNEVNSAPIWQPIADQSLHYGTPLTVAGVASDPDLPANTLTYTLDQGPANLLINATNGVITWNPDPTQVGTAQVTVRVTDNGSPSLSATTTFQVTVTGDASRLEIRRIASLVQISILADTGLDYELQKSVDLVNWERLVEFRLSSSPFQYVDPEPASEAQRFYRLRLIEAP